LESIPNGVNVIQVAVIDIAFAFTIVCLFFTVWMRIFFGDEVAIKLKTSQTNLSTSTTMSKGGSGSGSKRRGEGREGKNL